ncbi:MAG: histidine kinase, partial [Pseudomonadota bacterium]
MANTQTQAEIQTSENTLPAAIAGAAGRTRRAALWALAKKGRLFWTLQTVGWTGFFLMHLLSAVGYGKEWGYGVYSLASAVIGFVFTSLAMRPVFRAIWKKPPFVVLSVALATTALCALGVTISKAHAYRLLIEPAWAPASWLGYMTDVQFNLYIILSWAGFYFVINYYMMLRDQKEQALQSARLADQAQLKMLRYQLNPHFLFNTLNAVSTLVLDKQTEPANAMLTRLSAFLRYSLDSDPLQKTTFAEELRALELYLHIEKARFQDRLKLEIDVDPKA